MFNSMWKNKIIRTEERVANIENNSLPIFVEHGTGIVYAQSVGVQVPLRYESVLGGAGGSGGFGSSMAVRMGRGHVEIEFPAKRDFFMFHKDRVPQCDYVMKMRDGSLQFFKNQAPVQVDAKGNIIKAKKK